MPMFDDPKKHLRRMQEELLAAEEEEEYGEYSEQAEENLAAYRNYSNNYGRSRAARFVDTEDYEDDLDDEAYLSREDYRKAKKKQSNRGLLILICLELLAIAAVLGWWASWLL